MIDKAFSKSLALKLVVMLCLSLGCQQKSGDHLPHFFRNKFDLKRIYPPPQRIIKIRASNDTAIILTNNVGKYKLSLVNLVLGKPITLKRQLTVPEFSAFDYHNGIVSYYSIVKPDALYTYEIYENRLTKRDLSIDTVFSSVNLVNNKNQFFFIGHLYGLLALKKSGGLLYRKNANGITSHIPNEISLPVNDTLNLLSGDDIQDKAGVVYAIDRFNRIVWKKPIPSSVHGQEIKIFNYPNSFLICKSDSIIALRKTDGALIWGLHLDSTPKVFLRLTGGLFIVSGFNNFPNENKVNQLNINFLNLSDHSLSSKIKVISAGLPHVSIMDNELLVSDESNVNIVSISQKLKKTQLLKCSTFTSYSIFSNIENFHSGETYMIDDQSVVYR